MRPTPRGVVWAGPNLFVKNMLMFYTIKMAIPSVQTKKRHLLSATGMRQSLAVMTLWNLSMVLLLHLTAQSASMK